MDVVLCYNTWPHFDDPEGVIQEFARWLRPRGMALVWHDIGRERLAAIHAGAGGPIAADRLPPVGELGALFSKSDFGVLQGRGGRGFLHPSGPAELRRRVGRKPRVTSTAASAHVLVLAAAGLTASLAGWRSALVTSSVSPSWRPSLSPRLGIVLALARRKPAVRADPPPVRALGRRGRHSPRRGGVADARVSSAAGVTWSAAIAELQQLGLPRTGVAFLALVARHVEVLAEDARSTVAVLKVRGAFDRKAQTPRAPSVLLSRLLVLAWFRADRVADAMALRGFDGRLPPNPPWRSRRAEARSLRRRHSSWWLSAAWELGR